MHNAKRTAETASAEVVQFDDALLDTCGPELRAELITEAAMLAEAFAPKAARSNWRRWPLSLSRAHVTRRWTVRARASSLARCAAWPARREGLGPEPPGGAAVSQRGALALGER